MKNSEKSVITLSMESLTLLIFAVLNFLVSLKYFVRACSLWHVLHGFISTQLSLQDWGEEKIPINLTTNLHNQTLIHEKFFFRNIVP